jgi:anti-sigma factor ChrR (cupin superfamily)
MSAAGPTTAMPPELAGLPWKATAWPGIRLCFRAGPDGAVRGVLIAMDPGCAYPRHRHLGDEEVLVLAGEYADAWGVHRAGDFLLNPAGTEHGARAGAAGALLWARVPAGIEVLEQPLEPR